MTQPAGANRPFFQLARNSPEIIAHRGGGGEWPGETMYAFEKALELGVDVLEMDVRRTADDKLVLIHNRRVDQTTDGSGRIRRLKSTDIENLNAAARWSSNPAYGRIPIPHVEQALELLNSHPALRLNIEIKERDTRVAVQLAELLKYYGLFDRVLVASAWHSVLRRFRKVCPAVATSASVYEVWMFEALDRLLGLNYRPDTDAIQWSSKVTYLKIITQRFVDKAHSLNLKVHGWTVNEPEEMGRLIALGVDGIITDQPTTLMKLLRRVPL